MAEIGARLREARMRAKIDINQVEVATKIRAKYLRAMENDEWDLLPGEVYARSFLRTYGEFLGLDTRQLIDDFKRLHESPTDHEIRPMAPRRREREPRGPLVPPWATIALVLVAVLVVLYFVGVRTNSKSGTSSTPTATTGHHRRDRHHSNGPVHLPQKPKSVKLQLVPTGAVYVCVEDASGRKLIPGVIYNVGQTVPVVRAQKLLLTLGNASVHMKVDGVSVPVAPSSTSIGYELTPGSRKVLPPSAQPSCG